MYLYTLSLKTVKAKGSLSIYLFDKLQCFNTQSVIQCICTLLIYVNVTYSFEELIRSRDGIYSVGISLELLRELHREDIT